METYALNSCKNIQKTFSTRQSEKRCGSQWKRKVIFSQNHAEKILDLDRSVLLYSEYSPECAPSDFYIFRCLQNILCDKTFSLEKLKRL